MRRDTEQLIAAYVDGVTELTADERRRVEARLASDPDARGEADSTRSMLDQLRALPAEGTEPDWAAMQRSIGEAVGREPPRRHWWRSWRWLAPLATFATAGAILLVLQAPHGREVALPLPTLPVRTHQPAPSAAPSEVVPLWLDGFEIDVDPQSADTLGALDAIEAEVGVTDALGEPEPDEVGLLPAADLAWLDNLDDAALARAEQWLAAPKKGG